LPRLLFLLGQAPPTSFGRLASPFRSVGSAASGSSAGTAGNDPLAGRRLASECFASSRFDHAASLT
jgi:hypothetical protein